MLLTHTLLHRSEQDRLNVCQFKEIRISFVGMHCGGNACLVSSFVSQVSSQEVEIKRGANIRNRNECEQKETNMSVAGWPHWDPLI